jgi:multiple RNA-binding domain-containing protein 1
MEALKHTHLLGRHLVLEWAAEEEFADKEVERLREKAKREFVKDGEGLPSKKRKLGLKDGLAADPADEE